MNTLAVLRLAPSTDPDRVTPVLDDEVRALWRLYTAGVVIQVHLTDDPTTVVLLLDTKDPTQTRAALATLPLVAAGLMTAELHVLRPFHNWQRLFSDHDDT